MRDAAKSSWRRRSEKSSTGKQLKLALCLKTAACTNSKIFFLHRFSCPSVQLSVRKAFCPGLLTLSSDEEVQKGSAAASEECLHLTDVKVKPKF